MASLTGCYKVHYYSFNEVEINLFEGKLSIEVDGSPITKKSDLVIYGHPYFISFTYTTTIDVPLTKISVLGSYLIDYESQEIINLNERTKSLVSYHEGLESEGKLKSIVTGIGGEKYDIEHKKYKLVSTIVIHRNEDEKSEKTIEVDLIPTFEESTRSKKFDALMSV